MPFHKLRFAILTIMVFAKMNAQQHELGKVTVAELQEKHHPRDSAAVAAILFKKGEVRIVYNEFQGFSTVTEVKTKIKIYNKEGYSWANAKVFHEVGANAGPLNFSDAVTYNLVNGQIVKTKLKSDGEFDVKINKVIGQKQIALPNVKEGSIIEYSYTSRESFIMTPEKWSFQARIPVNYSEFTTKFPSALIYNTNQKGLFVPKKTTTTRNAGDYTEVIATYVCENLPAMQDEAFVNNIENYTSSIAHELSMIKYNFQPNKLLSTNWSAVAKEIYEYNDFGPELSKTGYFEKDIDALLVAQKTPNEIIDVIFNYVKSKMTWNNFDGYTCDDGVRKAYKDNIGNVAEINLMLTAMLRYAKLDANPVLLSTRENGIANFPSRSAFNYVIAGVDSPDGMVLLDATEKLSAPNVLPDRDLNWLGRLIRKDGTSIEIGLVPEAISKVTTFMSIKLKSDSSVQGQIRKQMTGRKAFEFREKMQQTKEDAYLEDIENNHRIANVGSYIGDKEKDMSHAAVESYSFEDVQHSEMINGKIYVSPLLFLTVKENPFKQEKREYPVDFGYPFEDKYLVNIEIPEGYAVESIPAPISVSAIEGIGDFKYIIATTGNKIQVTVTTNINATIVSADYYVVLKDFYQKIIDKQTEKIILKKL